jgi:ABC-2 family transporter protein
VAEIFRSTLRARGLRPAPLVLAFCLAGTAFVLGWADGGINPLTVNLLAIIFAIVTGAGLIGADVAEGTVQLVLTRALTRNEYLAGRFLGALTLAVAGGLMVVACDAGGALLNPRPRVEWPEVGALTLTLLARLLWQVSLCFALSTVVPGRGDVVAYLVILVASFVLASQAGEVLWPWLAASMHWGADQIRNDLVFSGGPSPAFWQDLARFSSNLTGALLFGAAVFHRREFSYGAG